MTLDNVANALDLIYLSNYKSSLKPCNDTFTISVEMNSKEQENEFEDRVNRVADRLRMKFTVVGIEMKFIGKIGSAEIEFFY